jgi:hypothetical protein
LRIEGTEMECPVSQSVSLHLAAAASGSGSAMLADVGCVVVVVRRCRRATDGVRTQHDASRCEAKVRRGKAKQGRGEGRVSRRSVPSGMYNGPGLGFVYSRTGWGARRCRSWREESKKYSERACDGFVRYGGRSETTCPRMGPEGGLSGGGGGGEGGRRCKSLERHRAGGRCLVLAGELLEGQRLCSRYGPHKVEFVKASTSLHAPGDSRRA